MSNIKKFFSKIKSEVKFSKAGEGHRLNEPTSQPSRNVQQAPVRPPTSARQNSDGGAAARAAADAAQQRLQHQISGQQSASASTKNFSLLLYERL